MTGAVVLPETVGPSEAFMTVVEVLAALAILLCPAMLLFCGMEFWIYSNFMTFWLIGF
jgi:hypothetical protein